MILKFSILIGFLFHAAIAAETKMNFVEFWKTQSVCSPLKNWKPILKLANFDFPKTKRTPMVWQSRVESDPLLFAAEPVDDSTKKQTFSNAWMLWDGRKNWVKLPLEKGTRLEDLTSIEICIYPSDHYFDLTIPDTDYEGANPRDCELKVLYQFLDPEIKFMTKRCN